MRLRLRGRSTSRRRPSVEDILWNSAAKRKLEEEAVPIKCKVKKQGALVEYATIADFLPGERRLRHKGRHSGCT